MIHTLSIKENTFILHASGSIFWKEKQMLLIADVHLGKVGHFRKAGMAVPPDSALKNYSQMTDVIDFFQPETVCFLGDLFHSAINNEWEVFSEWKSALKPQVVLIAGNHDVISPKKYHEIGVPIVSEWAVDGFLMTHHPEERSGLFTFCGHIHPGIKLRGHGRQWLKLPCFFKNQHQMILPAFGDFTGTYYLVPTEGDCVYALTKEEVIVVCD